MKEGGKLKVIIVEDSALVRELLREMISGISGIEVAGYAQEANEAINLIRERKPDVVLLDIFLYESNGIDVLKNIKKESFVPRVIIMTNHPYPRCRQKCMDEGADFFFDKSTELEKVTDALRGLIRDFHRSKGN